MQYRAFGSLDWEVSALGFGCMRFPTTDGKAGNIDQEQVTEMIRHAVDAGVNYFDTAYVYHDQKSEAALGAALKGGYRERVRIATKSAIWLLEDGDDFDRMLDEQLTRLQTDTIDFYLLHALNRDRWSIVQKFDLLRRSEAARADGRIRHLGFSFHDNLETFKHIVDGYDAWDFCQIQYNYMDTAFQAGKEGLQYAASKGLAVVIMESLRGGKLALDLPAARPIWDSAAQKRKPADWALQWLWNQPEVSVALSGMSTLEQVKENIASADASGVASLSSDEMALIDQATDAIKAMSPIPCTYCEYCLPCPNGVDIPLNFDYYNQVAMYGDIRRTRFQHKLWVPDDAKASMCIQCDECLSKCPQEIPISTWLPVVADVLEEEQPYVKSV